MSGEAYGDLFCLPKGNSPYRWNAYCVLDLQTGPLTLRQIVAAARRCEVNLQVNPRSAVIESQALDEAAICRAREALEDPNQRIVQSLLRHRPQKRFREACRKYRKQAGAVGLAELALELVAPRDVAEIARIPAGLRAQIAAADESEERAVLLEVLEFIGGHAPGPVSRPDLRKALTQLDETKGASSLRAARLCLRGRIQVALGQTDNATETVRLLEGCATTPSERESARTIRLSLRRARTAVPVHPALELIHQLVRAGNPDRAVPLLRAFVGHNPEHAAAHFLLGACCLALDDVGGGLAALRNACDVADKHNQAHLAQEICRFTRHILNQG